jgi:hypothetical protein
VYDSPTAVYDKKIQQFPMYDKKSGRWRAGGTTTHFARADFRGRGVCGRGGGSWDRTPMRAAARRRTWAWDHAHDAHMSLSHCYSSPSSP